MNNSLKLGSVTQPSTFTGHTEGNNFVGMVSQPAIPSQLGIIFQSEEITNSIQAFEESRPVVPKEEVVRAPTLELKLLDNQARNDKSLVRVG